MTEATAERLLGLGVKIGVTDLVINSCLISTEYEKELIKAIDHSIELWQEYWKIVRDNCEHVIRCAYPGGCGLRVGNKCDLIEPCEKYVADK